MPSTTNGITTTALDPPAVLANGARAAMRRLALEYAHGILDAPADYGLGRMADYRHAVLVLVHELERDDQQARNLKGVAQARRKLGSVARPLCPGSNEFVRADDTDGTGIGTCPYCLRYRPTSPMDGCDRWRYVAPHLART